MKGLLTILKEMDANYNFSIFSATQLITKASGKMDYLMVSEELYTTMDRYTKDASTKE